MSLSVWREKFTLTSMQQMRIYFEARIVITLNNFIYLPIRCWFVWFIYRKVLKRCIEYYSLLNTTGTWTKLWKSWESVLRLVSNHCCSTKNSYLQSLAGYLRHHLLFNSCLRAEGIVVWQHSTPVQQ